MWTNDNLGTFVKSISTPSSPCKLVMLSNEQSATFVFSAKQMWLLAKSVTLDK